MLTTSRPALRSGNAAVNNKSHHQPMRTSCNNHHNSLSRSFSTNNNNNSSNSSSITFSERVRNSLHSMLGYSYHNSFVARVRRDAPKDMSPEHRDTDILSFSTFVARSPLKPSITTSASRVPTTATTTTTTILKTPVDNHSLHHKDAYDFYPGVRGMSTQAEGGKKFMVCLDGSDHAFRALEVAARLVNPRHGDQLYITTIPPTIDVNPSLGADFIEAIRQERDKASQALVDDAAAKFPELKNSVVKVVGIPAGGPREQILEFAEKNKIDFIVMGSRGMGTVKRMLLGSVSNYVVNHAHCNVLVVK